MGNQSTSDESNRLMNRREEYYDKICSEIDNEPMDRKTAYFSHQSFEEKKNPAAHYQRGSMETFGSYKSKQRKKNKVKDSTDSSNSGCMGC